LSAFLDASAIVAALGRESDGPSFEARIASMDRPLYVSSLVRFEAMLSLARKKATPGRRPTVGQLAEARDVVDDFITALGAHDVPIDAAIGERAMEAAMRFGKVVGHPAQLNVGDCFHYACAQANGVPLLYKGDDFAKTDIEAA